MPMEVKYRSKGEDVLGVTGKVYRSCNSRRRKEDHLEHFGLKREKSK
jgi:hypothetical protein